MVKFYNDEVWTRPGRATMVAAALLLIIYAASSMKIPPAKIPPVRSRIKPGKHGYLLNNEHHLSSGERYDAEAAYAHERKLADDEMRLPCAKFTDVTSCTQTRVGCGWCVSTSSVRLLLSAARGLDRLIDTQLSLLSSLTLFFHTVRYWHGERTTRREVQQLGMVQP